MDDNREVKYKITPEFNLLYELGMPTGRKIRTSIFFIIIFLIATIVVIVKAGNLSFANYEIFNNIKVDKFLLVLCIIADIVTIIRLVGIIIFQKLQYNHITYTFYDHMMIYEDDFLNQHRKNIEYKNIKEVEIRRTVWDRILDYGVMIVYTNADNDRNNGLVIYSVRNPKSHYDVIDKLIHNRDNNISKTDNNLNYTNSGQYDEVKEEKQDNIEQIQNVKTSYKEQVNSEDLAARLDPDSSSGTPEEDFKNNLRNINK